MNASEQKRQRKSWVVTAGVQLLLLVSLYLIIAWKEPFPPIPTYGIELGFTSDNQNVSTNESPDPTQTSSSLTEIAEQVESETLEVEEALETTGESKPEIASDIPADDTPADLTSLEQIDEVSEELQENELEGFPSEIQNEPLEEEENTPKHPVESSKENLPTEDSENQSDSKSSDSQTLDDRAIYSGGSSTGASLQLSGWDWDTRPQPKDDSDESGKIEYDIVVDEEGYLLSIKLVSSSVSATVERNYRRSIEELTFSKNSEYQAAATSKGRVTFIIRTK